MIQRSPCLETKLENYICSWDHDLKELNIFLGTEMDRNCVTTKACKLM